MDLDLQIRDEKGRTDHAVTPDDLMTSEFLKEFLSATGRSHVDQQGVPIPWVLVDESTGRVLDNRTFRENGIPPNRVLLLLSRPLQPPPPPEPRWRCPKCRFENLESSMFCAQCGTPRFAPTIQVIIQDPKGRILAKQVSPTVLTQHLLRDVLAELGLPPHTNWEIDDKEIPRNLSLHETLEKNGVLDGHHLFLREVQPPPPLPIPWGKIAIAAAVAVVLGLAGYIVYLIVIEPHVTVTISPSGDLKLAQAESKQFSAKVIHTPDTRVVWSIEPVGAGAITQDGHYVAPSSVTHAQQVSIVATSVADKSRNARVLVSLVPVTPGPVQTNISIQITTPEKVTLQAGQSELFSVQSSSDGPSVTWSIDPPNAGSISQIGMYTAPSTIAQNQNVSVIATSTADASKSDRISIVVTPAQPHVRLYLIPKTQTLHPSESLQFTAVEEPHASHAAVHWSLKPQVGQISQDGLYTAPATVSQEQTIRIRAVLSGESPIAATATLTLQPPPPPPAHVCPACASVIGWTDYSSVTLHASQQHQFQVIGIEAECLTWSVVGPGSIQHGLYVAPSNISSGQQIYVKARCRKGQEIERAVTLEP